MNLVANEIHFLVVKFWLYSYKFPEIFMHYLFTSGGIYVSLHKYSCLIGTLSTMVQVGGMGQGPATKVTHLGLN